MKRREDKARFHEHIDIVWAKCELAAAHERYKREPTPDNDVLITKAVWKVCDEMLEHTWTHDQWLEQHMYPPYTFERYVWNPKTREYDEIYVAPRMYA
jgi:hypothetical protein